ncbi:ABC transporter ATP-binding protein [Erysipelothrix sp. HDW6C]|nr:ABC transporter ATP-binding protein [Erysipelothrix sp. HDW6C]
MHAIWSVIKIGSWAFVLSVIGASIVSLSNFGLSFLIGKITQVSIDQASAGTFDLHLMISLATYLVIALPFIIMGQTLNLVGGQFAEKRLKGKMIDHVLHQSEADIVDGHSGDMMNLLTNDAAVINDFYFQGLSHRAIGPLVAGIASLIVTFSVDIRFGIIAVIIGLTTVLTSTRYSKRIQDGYLSAREAQNSATNHVSEILTNEEFIRLYGIDHKLIAEYDQKNMDYGKKVLNAERNKHKVTGWNESFDLISKIAFLGVGIYFSFTSHFPFSKVMLLLPLQGSISYMFGNLGVSWNYILETATSATRIDDFLTTERENLRMNLPSLQSVAASSKILFDHVSFGYNRDHHILNDVTLDIDAKETVAFVGASGSGKSTLMKLLLGFYNTDSGNIYIDTQDVMQFNLPSVRSQMSYVQQEAPLFNLSIRENIKLGATNYDTVDDSAIIVAAKKAAIHDFIMTLPKGYDTQVGENAGKISGGQRQRIAIARAFMSDAPILIMDEPTASLDSESENLVQLALQNIRKEKTVLIAAHRLRTIQDADTIVVLDHGHITEKGNHRELIEREGHYFNTFQNQHN